MKIQMTRQQQDDTIRVGDSCSVEGHGDCVVVLIDNAAAGLFTVLTPAGVQLILRVFMREDEPLVPTHEAPTTLQ